MQQVLSPSAGARPAPLRRSFQAAAALGSLILGILGFGGACGDGEKCVGGVLNEATGVCEGKCQPDKCLDGNTCVGNRCVLTCDSHADCFAGTQDCAAAVEDDTGAQIMACTANAKEPGYGTGCPFGIECGGFGACPDGSACSALPCGGVPDSCVRDEAVCGSDESCAVGKCPDGSGCTVAKCVAAECNLPLSCIGKGEGDADAYCAAHGCTTSADCPGGFECGITRDPREICGTDKGNSNVCGTTNETCVASGELAAAGLMEGSLCILQNTCIKRTQCASCETDLDCSLVEGQRCVAIGGENRCARACNYDSDCDPDYACDPTGACTPRFGACKGQGGFCEPCQNDTDCGGPDTSKACVELSGGQRACFDYSFPDTCSSDADCPMSPGGRRGSCLDEGEGVTPQDSVYHRCYVPLNPADNKSGCW